MIAPRDLEQLRTLAPDVLESALRIWAEADAILAGTGLALSLAGPHSCARTAAEQHAIYEQGRKLVGRRWAVVGPVVTKCDGTRRKSDHQTGRAVDLGLRDESPTPGMGKFWWDDPKSTPERVRGLYCQIVGLFLHHGWRWGGDWQTFPDRHHFWLPASPAKGVLG